MPRRSAVREVGPRRSALRIVGRLLTAVGTSALVILVIITITGGFTLRAGPLYLSAHNWRGPLLIALTAFAAVALLGRAALADAASESWHFVDSHALAFAIVLASVAAGVGMAYGTYSASSSDASGYISEAQLLASARLTTDEPLARSVAWPNATWAFTPLGYRPGPEAGELVPTYPAGLPLVIAPVRLLAGEQAGYLVVPFLGAVAVLATFFLATSPIFLFQLVQPMSDVAVTAWWTIALLFAISPLPNSALASGAVAGLAVLTRPNLLPLAAVIAVAAMNYPRGGDDRRLRVDRLIAFAAGITPAIGAQLLMQWRLYGSPFASGYGAASDLFAVSNIAPNAVGCMQRMLRGEAPALVLAALALLVIAIAHRHRRDTPPLKRPVVFATLASAIVVASYLPYGVFAE